MSLNELRDLLKTARESGIALGPAPDSVYGEPFTILNTKTSVDLERRIQDHVTSLPKLDIFCGQLLVLGRNAVACGVDRFVKYLLKETAKVGEVRAIEKLSQLLELGYIPAFQALALGGVAVTQETQLPNGIKLVPFAAIPDSFVKRMLNAKASQFPESPMPITITGEGTFVRPEAGLVRELRVTPQRVERPEDIQWDKHRDILFDIAACMALVANCVAIPLIAWGAVDKSVPCSAFLQGGYSHPGLGEFRKSPTHALSSCEIEDLKRVVEQYYALSDNVRSRVSLAMHRLLQARQRLNPTERAIDIGIVLEVLLLNDRDAHDPISLPLRLRGAWLLGESPSHRGELVRVFRYLYDCRCNAVHNGRLSPKLLSKLSLFDQGDALCVQIIRKILRAGSFPDWDSLILGK